ncbi:MAG TPA: Ig-like domain-containing protein [Verrucomicrobiae bacterium]|nr:Ig-like domain-containing protein [Verrucomicrobiae bacterium]
MKNKTFIATLIAGIVCGFAAPICRAQDVDAFPPVVVKTVPEAGSTNVPPGEFEIRITFSKEMTDQSWSWGTAWKGSTPESLGKPHYLEDRRTCVMKVKLDPGKTYGWWINSQNFHGFRDRQGHAAIPYLLTFKTSDQ